MVFIKKLKNRKKKNRTKIKIVVKINILFIIEIGMSCKELKINHW